MEPLPRIPVPPSAIWREVRVQVLPLFFFIIVLVSIVLLWRSMGTSGGIPAMGEGVRTSLSCSQDGTLMQLLVEPYQLVEAGQPIAIIQPYDPGMNLDLIQTELALAKERQQPTLAEENALNFERIRVELLKTKAELAMAVVNLERAENQVRRNEPLYREKLVSEDAYDLAAKTRDMYQAEVRTKSNAVAAIEGRLTDLTALGVPQVSTNREQPWLVRLQDLRTALETNMAPLTLRASIAGMVSSVYRRPGENVIGGEPLLTINSLWSDRIVGYLRQPYPMEPAVGQIIQIVTRERQRRTFGGRILQVGAQVEIITNALAMVRPNALIDVGLPIVVATPGQLRLRPGEMVDLSWTANPNPLTLLGPEARRRPSDGKP